MKKHLKKAFADSFLPCALVALTFGLIGPVTLYISNHSEFEFYLTDILSLLALYTFLFYVVLQIICLCIKNRKVRSIVTAVILGIGIGFYVQANFLSGGYGQLNGEEIDWASMMGKGVINTFVWIASIAAPVVTVLIVKKNKKRFLYLRMAAGCLLAVQVLACGIALGTTDLSKAETSDEFFITTDGAFTLSDQKNVVVFLLDSFNSPLFDEIVLEDGIYHDEFDGFTFFPDTVGVGTSTKGTLPYILTGVWNENTLTYQDYLDYAYKDNELYKTLDKLEFDTRLYVQKRYVSGAYAHYFDNMSNGRARISPEEITALMYRFTAFTYVPHYLKPAFWFYSGDFTSASNSLDNSLKLSPDPTFYSTFVKNGITVNADYEGAFRFYYLTGAHPPYAMNENAEAVESGSVTQVQKAQGSLKIVTTYMQELKDKGLYDNTMIVVLADHGAWSQDHVFNPLLLVKPFDAGDDDLVVSNAQISHEDLMPTLLESVTGKDAGTTVFEVDENEQRERRFLYYSWDGKWDADYLPDLHEYMICGNVRDIASRVVTGTVYTGDGVINNATSYTLGTVITYDQEHSSDPKYVLYGLQYPATGYTWTKGTYTIWAFPLESYDCGDLAFTLKMVNVKNQKQRVLLTVNNEFVEEVTLTKERTVTFTIPEELIGTDRLIIRLDMPDATNSEKDSRIVSLALKTAVLDYAQ